MSKRMRRSATEWAGLIQTWESSGMNRATFCQEHGVSIYSFDYWRYRLAGRACKVTSAQTGITGLVEIRPLVTTGQSVKPHANSLGFGELVNVRFPSGMALELRFDGNAETLVQLMQMVKSV